MMIGNVSYVRVWYMHVFWKSLVYDTIRNIFIEEIEF